MSRVPTLHLACAVEGSYDSHSAALLHSAAVNRGTAGLHVHYLHGPDYPRSSSRQIQAMLDRLDVEATFYEVPDSRVAGLPVVSEFTSAMWYRIFLPDLVDSERVIYADADTLVVDSLEPLWRTDLGVHPLGAVRNVFMPHHLDRPAALGLAGPEVYFNSGVLLMDLDEMRRTGATRALQEHASGPGKGHEWPDQDTLNIVFEGRWRSLHPRWNVMNSMRFPHAPGVFEPGAVEEARRRPGIRHFEGPGANKPWHYGCARADRELYFEHRRQTPWPDLELVGEPRGRLRAQLGRIGRRARGVFG